MNDDFKTRVTAFPRERHEHPPGMAMPINLRIIRSDNTKANRFKVTDGHVAFIIISVSAALYYD
jgi:hypothetical protein